MLIFPPESYLKKEIQTEVLGSRSTTLVILQHLQRYYPIQSHVIPTQQITIHHFRKTAMHIFPMQTRKLFPDLAVRPYHRNASVPRTPSLGVKQASTFTFVTTILSSNSLPEPKKVENSKSF